MPGRGDGSIQAVPPTGAFCADAFLETGARGAAAGDWVIQLSWAAVGSLARDGEGAECGTGRGVGFSATGDWEIQLSSGDAEGLGGGGGAGLGVKPDLGAGLAEAGDCEIQLSWAEGVDLGAGGADLGAGGALDGCEIQLSVAEACGRGTGGGGAGRDGGACVPLSNQLSRLGCGWTGSDEWVRLPDAEGE